MPRPTPTPPPKQEPTLLYGYETLSKQETKKVVRRYRRCKIVGHIWELESLTPPATYVIMCSRCFPHYHSRRTVTAYNLFPAPPVEPDPVTGSAADVRDA